MMRCRSSPHLILCSIFFYKFSLLLSIQSCSVIHFAITMTTASTSDIKLVEAPKEVKVIDSIHGAQIVKGGQLYADSFFVAIKAAYCNVVYNPVYVALYFLAVAVLLTETPGVQGPLELMADVFNATAHNPDRRNSQLVATIMFNIVEALIDYKSLFVLTVLWFTPVILKPSSYNIAFATVAGFVMIAWKTLPVFNIILVSQTFFLYTQIRAPLYRFVLIALCALSFLSSFSYTQETIDRQIGRKLLTGLAFQGNFSDHPFSDFEFVTDDDGKRYVNFKLTLLSNDANMKPMANAHNFRIPEEQFKRFLSGKARSDGNWRKEFFSYMLDDFGKYVPVYDTDVYASVFPNAYDRTPPAKSEPDKSSQKPPPSKDEKKDEKAGNTGGRAGRSPSDPPPVDAPVERLPAVPPADIQLPGDRTLTGRKKN